MVWCRLCWRRWESQPPGLLMEYFCKQPACLQDSTGASGGRKRDFVPCRTGTKLLVWMAPKGKVKQGEAVEATRLSLRSLVSSWKTWQGFSRNFWIEVFSGYAAAHGSEGERSEAQELLRRLQLFPEANEDMLFSMQRCNM